MKNFKTILSVSLLLGILICAFVFPLSAMGADELSLAGGALMSTPFLFTFKSTFEDFRKHEGIDEEKMKKMEEEGDAEALADLYNKYNQGLRDAIKKAEDEATASKEEIQKMKDQRDAEVFKQMTSLNAVLKAQGVVLKKLTSDEASVRNKTFAEALKMQLNSKLDALKTIKTGGQKDVRDASFVIKVVGDITSANISGGNLPVEDRLSGFDTIPTRAVRLLDVVSRSVTTSNLVSWVSQVNKDGSAGQTAEGATKNQIDFDFVIDAETLKKTTAFIKVSTEMIDDVDFIMAEIRNELLRELLLKVETQVYSGDNAGQNLNGIRTQAPAFAAGTFANTIDNANEIDVLTVAMNQIEIAEQGEPTAIFMHPSNVNALKMVKVSATDKRYVERLVMVAGQMELDGVPIIKTTLVTAGEYLVGNFVNANVIQKAGVLIDIGLDGNDFTKNMRTILAEWRGLNLIKTNKVTSFVKGTFATDKAALETT